MYVLPEFNLKLMPRLLALKPATRIVSYDGEAAVSDGEPTRPYSWTARRAP